MATNCLIALKGRTYRTIYCHWDGYPDHVLKILKENYNTKPKVQELINLGYISSLGKSISTTRPYENGEIRVISTFTLKELKEYSIDYVYVFDTKWRIL